MAYTIALALIIVATALRDPIDRCPKYICNSTAAKAGEDCFSNNGTDFFGASCPSTQRCPNILDLLPSKCKDKGFDGIPKMPGQFAYNATDCFSKKMDKTYCVGLAQGMSCKDHSECDVDLICILSDVGGEKMCLPAKKEGEGCDHTTKWCASGLYCDNKDFVCEYYGSTKVGKKVGTAGQSSECESFFLDLTDKVTCISPPKRTSAQLVNLGDKCNFTYTNAAGAAATFIEESACGMTASGQAWCDPDYSSLDKQRANLINFVKNDNKSCPCHVFDPFPFCQRAKEEMSGFMDAVKAFYELKIHDMDQLYKTVVNVDKCFWDVNAQYYYGGAFEVTLMGLLFTLVLLI